MAAHPVQRAWEEIDVPQCGYCQAGQIMTAAALLARTPSPSDEEIADGDVGQPLPLRHLHADPPRRPPAAEICRADQRRRQGALMYTREDVLRANKTGAAPSARHGVAPRRS